MDTGPTSGGPCPVGDKMDDGPSEEVQEKEEDVCALFATSMPRDIWANPSLAALAGLIDEDEDQKDNSNSQAEEGKQTSDDVARREDVSKASDPGVAKDADEALLSCPAAATDKQRHGAIGSGTSGARHQRREDTRRRRHDRRATPYGGGGIGGRRERGEDQSSELEAARRRAGPTTGETQVLMSLWGL